jgi:hypothetical protein
LRCLPHRGKEKTSKIDVICLSLRESSNWRSFKEGEDV